MIQFSINNLMNLRSKWIIFLLPAVLGVGMLKAQEAAVGDVFTLEQCIEYALSNGISAQNSVIDEQIAQARVKEIVGLGLPQVSGSASVTHNQKLQRFFGMYPGDDAEFSFFGGPVAGAQIGDVLAAENFFQLKSSGNMGLSVNQLIFNGSYIVGLQAANAFKDLAVKNSDQTREQVVEMVTKAYYTVLINKERLALFDANIARVDSLLRNTRALNQSGFAEKIDVDRIQVTYNNILTERDRFANINELGVALLKFQMNYPMDQPLQIAGDIQEMIIDPSVSQVSDDWDYKNRADYRVLQANHTLQKLNIKNKYAETLPSLSAFASLGYATQSNGIGGIFKTESAVEDLGQVGPDKWYGYSQFGVSLNVPIFTGLQRNYQIQQEKLSLLKIENGFKALESQIDFEIQQSSLNFENAIKSLEAQQANMDLAENVARVTKIKYEQGVGSNLEVIEAENSLRNAQTNYYTALYEAIVARVELDKARGELNK